MTIEKNTFIEIEFDGKIKDGDLFDSTNQKNAEKLGVEKEKLKPLIVSVGNDMVVKGLDKEFLKNEVGKDYEIELKPEEAFGKRDPKLIQMVPLKNFLDEKINPQRGMQFSLDGRVAKVLSVSGGRVMVDFNNILAGKNIVYNYKITRKVDDLKERFDSLQQFFFKKVFDSEVKQEKIHVKVDKKFAQLFEIMKDKFKEILGKEIVVEEVEQEKEKDDKKSI